MSTSSAGAIMESVQEFSTSPNFLTQTCRLCGEQILIGDGDVLYGDLWYHASCWGRIPKVADETRGPDGRAQDGH